MTEAPKRIWAWPHFDGWITGDWSANTYHDDRTVEYVRADEHDRLMAEKDAEIERLREALTALVKTHDRENFMRSADFHREDCRCLRCAFDRARAALGDTDE